MYRLLSGLHAHLTRKEEFNVIILGLDHAGKTTLLEKVKTVYSPSHPGLNPSQISPTMGQNIGKITISSSHLQFWDLGGSSEIRPIWEKYYKEADAICWVLDSQDRIRNGWPEMKKGKGKAKDHEQDLLGEGWLELLKVLSHPSIAEAKIPLLLVANKQDGPRSSQQRQRQEERSTKAGKRPARDEDVEEGLLDGQEEALEETGVSEPMPVEEIKELFNRLVMESDRSEKARALGLSEAHVVGVSAVNGHGVRDAINWLFYRVASKGQSRKSLAAAAALANVTSPEPSRSNPPARLSHSVRLGNLSQGSNTPSLSRNSSYQNK